MTTDLVPLQSLAAEINARLQMTGKADENADDHRLAAGLLLIRARKRVKAGEAGSVGWTEWVTENIRRSPGNVRKLIKRASNGRASQPSVREVDHLTRSNVLTCHPVPGTPYVERDRKDAELLHWLALHEVSLRKLARAMNEASELTETTNRVLIEPGLPRPKLKHLRAAIAQAILATEIARDAMQAFTTSIARSPTSRAA